MSSAPDHAATHDAPSTLALWLTLATFLGAVALNVHHAAAWCAPLAFATALWRARRLQGAPVLPPRSVRVVIVIALTLAVLIGFRTLNGVEAGSSLLVVMGALKLGETTRLRDWLVVLGASVFLLLAACLDAQALWRLPLYLAELWLLCTTLYALHAGPTAALRPLLHTAARTLLLALPLAVVLFLFVPRLAGSFWALPASSKAETGLGDEMSPGSISELVDSDAPALRARFEGALPPPAQRYWRGPVLHDFDGFTWRRRRTDLIHTLPLAPQGLGYRYEITLEPNEHNVLIALELPFGTPDNIANVIATSDYQLLMPRTTPRAQRYELLSFPEHENHTELGGDARTLDLRLPARRNPRSIALAHSLRAGVDSDAAYVNAVLDYLRHGGFYYTRTPQLLQRDSIDDLLFNTHAGFCGHFASAFAMLMRAGGVPARVVTGYLGGEWNRFGGYLLIRQSNAHAWTEVWLEGRGWVRVDPTAVIAPAQLSGELAGLLPSTGERPALYAAPGWITGTIQAWQALNAAWQDDIIGFNYARQLALLDRLGLHTGDWQGLVALLTAGSVLWLAISAFGLRPRTRSSTDALGRSWRTLERKLRPITRPAYEGPLAFAERVAMDRPELAGTVHALARRYAELRYGPAPDPQQLLRFHSDVRRLRVPSKSLRTP